VAVVATEKADTVIHEVERVFPSFEITHLHDDVFRVDGDFTNPA
jgi:hypothetical protein